MCGTNSLKSQNSTEYPWSGPRCRQCPGPVLYVTTRDDRLWGSDANEKPILHYSLLLLLHAVFMHLKTKARSALWVVIWHFNKVSPMSGPLHKTNLTAFLRDMLSKPPGIFHEYLYFLSICHGQCLFRVENGSVDTPFLSSTCAHVCKLTTCKCFKEGKKDQPKYALIAINT